MRSRTTWVAIFFIFATVVLYGVLDFALTDIFLWARVNNFPILGAKFTLSSLVSLAVAAVALGVCLFSNIGARQFVKQSVTELDKVNWPSMEETRKGTGVVILTSIVASAILGLFDTLFGWITTNNFFLR